MVLASLCDQLFSLGEAIPFALRLVVSDASHAGTTKTTATYFALFFPNGPRQMLLVILEPRAKLIVGGGIQSWPLEVVIHDSLVPMSSLMSTLEGIMVLKEIKESKPS